MELDRAGGLSDVRAAASHLIAVSRDLSISPQGEKKSQQA
jgi:hypothetical protein